MLTLWRVAGFLLATAVLLSSLVTDRAPTLLAQTGVATISLASPISAPVVDPLAHRVFVSSGINNTVFVVDSATNTVRDRIGGFSGPAALAVNPTTQRLYVANSNPIDGRFPLAGTVSALDVNTYTTVAHIPTGGVPHAIAVNSRTNRLYVRNFNAPGLLVFDTATNAPITTISSNSSYASSLAVDETTNRIYLATSGEDWLTVIDGDTNVVLFAVHTGYNVGSIVVSPITHRVYLGYGNHLQVFSGDSGELVDDVYLQVGVDSLALNPATAHLYAPRFDPTNQTRDVLVIDETTRATVAILSLGQAPTGIAIDPTTSRVYITDFVDGTISVLQDTPSPPTATPSPTSRRSATPSLGPTGTSTAVPAPCAPRPPINVGVDSTGDGRVSVTITATTNPGTPTNALSILGISGGANALVYLETGAQPLPIRQPLPPGTTQAAFQLASRVPGEPSTVNLVVTDACGDWSTFVGGGTAALGTPTPVRTPTMTATATRTAPPTLVPTPTPWPSTPTLVLPAPICRQQPPVSVTVQPQPDGRLQVAILTEPQTWVLLSSVHFGNATNALIDVPGGPTGLTGNTTVTLPRPTYQWGFYIRQTNAAMSATVPLVISESCGEWVTVVGGGPSAFATGTPSPSPTTTATPTATTRSRTASVPRP